MMEKLYKRENEKWHFYAAWNDGQKVTVSWGEVGRAGSQKQTMVPRGKAAATLIVDALEPARAAGYSPIDIEYHTVLVLQYPTTGWGTVEDLEKRYEVEAIVNETLSWTGNGHCDGGQIGSGAIEVFAFVIDPQIACDSLVETLEKHGLLENLTIGYRTLGRLQVLWAERVLENR